MRYYKKFMDMKYFYVILLWLLHTTRGFLDKVNPCHDGWYYSNLRCYKLLRYRENNFFDRSWGVADAVCRAHDAHLVTYNSPLEAYAVKKYLDRSGFEKANLYWLGLRVQGGVEQWVDGGDTTKYTHWHSGLPPEWLEVEATNDGYAVVDAQGRWYKVPSNWLVRIQGCDEPAGFVCEQKASIADIFHQHYSKKQKLQNERIFFSSEPLADAGDKRYVGMKTSTVPSVKQAEVSREGKKNSFQHFNTHFGYGFRNYPRPGTGYDDTEVEENTTQPTTVTVQMDSDVTEESMNITGQEAEGGDTVNRTLGENWEATNDSHYVSLLSLSNDLPPPGFFHYYGHDGYYTNGGFNTEAALFDMTAETEPETNDTASGGPVETTTVFSEQQFNQRNALKQLMFDMGPGQMQDIGEVTRDTDLLTTTVESTIEGTEGADEYLVTPDDSQHFVSNGAPVYHSTIGSDYQYHYDLGYQYVNAEVYCATHGEGIHAHPMHCWQFLICGQRYGGPKEGYCYPGRRFNAKFNGCVPDKSCIYGSRYVGARKKN